MKKFENCNVIDVLYEIMWHNTEHYRNDFVIDKKILAEAAVLPNKRNRRLLWLSRPSGTVCVPERETYLKNTSSHNTWKYYGEETHDDIKAYFVELNSIDGGNILGDIYELNYDEHWRQVVNNAKPIAYMHVAYQDGMKLTIPYMHSHLAYLNGRNIQHMEFLPFDITSFNAFLDQAYDQMYLDCQQPWDLEKLKMEYGEADYPTFGIYQLNGTDEAQNLLFLSYDKLQKHNQKVDGKNYECVYVALHKGENLEELFDRFNNNHPMDYCAHSLTVSDVVVLRRGEQQTAYFVDKFGFKEVPEFFGGEPLAKKPTMEM